jgi:hypothetical protein
MIRAVGSHPGEADDNASASVATAKTILFGKAGGAASRAKAGHFPRCQHEWMADGGEPERSHG